MIQDGAHPCPLLQPFLLEEARDAPWNALASSTARKRLQGWRGVLGVNANPSLRSSGLDSRPAEVAISADVTSGSQQPGQATLVQSPFERKEQTFHS